MLKKKISFIDLGVILIDGSRVIGPFVTVFTTILKK